MKTDKSLPWLRLYTEIIDDEKLGLLAFEDRWHYVAILCLKGRGILDAGDSHELMQRKVALKLGLTMAETEKVALRLASVGLIDQHSFQPLAWDNRQRHSDVDPTNAERQRRFKERKKQGKTPGNGGNASVTVLDTDTDTEEETHTAGAREADDQSDAEAGVWGENFNSSPNPQSPNSPNTPCIPKAVPAETARSGLTRCRQPAGNADPDDVAVCAALQKLGIGDAIPGNPKLLALLGKGVTLGAFESAARSALLKTRNDLAYVLGIVRRVVQEAADIGSGPGVPEPEWDRDRRSIEAEGVRLGLGRWDADNLSPGREQFAAYTERVRRAREFEQRRAA